MRALPHGKTITIVRPGPATEDDYGNDVPGPPTEIEVGGCAVEPMDGTGAGPNEDTQGRQQVISGLRVFCPYGTVIHATDQVRVDGELYEVYGKPGPGAGFLSPFTGSTGPVVVALTLVTG
ncbi:hypothetical protein [Streptomyces sp. C10-9-1]|uniref:hypothetical protein n=1 Tax=Streptomyces sp. C10-9-1 TaxID=1859285 RepID=UPI003F4A2245